MEETKTLVLFGRELTPYAVFIIAGVLAGLLVFILRGRKLKPLGLALTAVLSVFLGLLGARAFYVLARFELFAEVGFNNFFRTNDPDGMYWGSINGAGLWGAVGGAALAALIAGKITKTKVSALLDAMAPGAALAIALSRFGEYSIGEGIGPDVSEPGLCFFPVAVVNEWEEWKYAIFLLEGIAALIIFMVLMCRQDKWKDGYRARLFLILYSSCQIVLEAMRRDNFLRWLFVRVSQLTAAIVLLGLFVFAVIRWAKQDPAVRMPKKHLIICGAVFVVLIIAVIALEFAVDKSADLSVALAYALEACCAAGFGIVTYHVVMKN